MEFTEIPPTTDTDEVSKSNTTDVIDEESRPSSKPPIPRIYSWINFRQLGNLGRKSDQALVEYFQAFYRMCQRVCKKELTGTFILFCPQKLNIFWYLTFLFYFPINADQTVLYCFIIHIVNNT